MIQWKIKAGNPVKRKDMIYADVKFLPAAQRVSRPRAFLNSSITRCAPFTQQLPRMKCYIIALTAPNS